MSEIAFTKVKLPYGWLGNMSPYPIDYEGKTYRTTEALFQCLRFTDFPEVQEEIRSQTSPMSAKMIAKSYVNLIPNYNMCGEEDQKNMALCLQLKVEQHPQLVKDLLDTGTTHIIEDCSSRPHGTGVIWGAAFQNGQWIGKNILGNLWMELREELKLQQTKKLKP